MDGLFAHLQNVETDFAHLQVIAEDHGIVAFGLHDQGSFLDHPTVVEEVEICRAHLGKVVADGMDSLVLQEHIQRASGCRVAHGSVIAAAIDAGWAIEPMEPCGRVARINVRQASAA